MASEPINLFSRRIDPAGVLELLRKIDPKLQCDGAGSDWTEATIRIARGLLKKPLKLTIRHHADYYDGEGWPSQRAGMQGYFSRFPLGDRMPQIMRLIGSFEFALATSFEPDLDESGYAEEEDDPRMKVVQEIARHLDAAIYRPSGLYDASGLALASADGSYDSDAVFPAIPPQPEAIEEPDTERVPPSADRVARRTLALAAVSARALLEQEDRNDPNVEDTRKRIIEWIQSIGIDEELEPDEWKVIQRPLGRLSQQEAINATWRLEGLGVLAWALNRQELLPIDELVQPNKLLPSVGLLHVDRANALLAEPALRAPEELQQLADRMFALHWRIRNYSLKPEAMNFREFAKTAWFGPLDITGLRLIGDDLALGDHPIHEAPREAVGTASSAAMERHQASNWLVGEHPVYSDVDTPT